jgi:hypothetical protein
MADDDVTLHLEFRAHDKTGTEVLNRALRGALHPSRSKRWSRPMGLDTRSVVRRTLDFDFQVVSTFHGVTDDLNVIVDEKISSPSWHYPTPAACNVIVADTEYQLAEVLDEWMRRVVQRQRAAHERIAIASLVQTVEELLHEVDRRILQNTELLNALDERDQLIEQLEATIRVLRAEIYGRDAPSRRRVSLGTRLISELVLPALVTFSAQVAATHVDPPELSGPAPQVEVRINVENDQAVLEQRIAAVLRETRDGDAPTTPHATAAP